MNQDHKKNNMKKIVAVNALTLYEKYGMGGSIALSSEQILHIMQKTPKEHIYQRPAKGGGVWDYVTGTYVEKVLNYVFGWDWDYEALTTEEKYGQIIVRGRLTIRTITGKNIVKNQTGRADIKYKKGTQIPMDYGNDEKAANTDALKKCASLLGIASDVYGKNEFKEIKTKEVNTPEELGAEKERNRIITYIKDAKTAKELAECEEFLTDGEMRKLFDDRMDELERKSSK